MSPADVPSVPEEDTRGQLEREPGILGLLNVFERMLLAMEARLVAKMDDNARAASERWARHDEDHRTRDKISDDRFMMIERNLQDHLDKSRTYIQARHDAEVRADARVKPVLTVAQYIVKNWRSIALLVLVALVILGYVSGDVRQLVH